MAFSMDASVIHRAILLLVSGYIVYRFGTDLLRRTFLGPKASEVGGIAANRQEIDVGGRPVHMAHPVKAALRRSPSSTILVSVFLFALPLLLPLSSASVSASMYWTRVLLGEGVVIVVIAMAWNRMHRLGRQ